MKCEYCDQEIKANVCPKCNKDFDDSIRWFQEEFARGYHAKEESEA
ncbi:MAG TPA: hypothetical protein VFJ51_04420 [Nitrososphaeraceae archaeon]|nr:hypothetical protein [Nitrososphaeraceae archaeon]